LISLTSGATDAPFLSGVSAAMARRFFDPMTPPMPPRPQKRALLSPLFSWFTVESAIAA
jgi:hypothetical protein